jgi:magnesium transporter
MAKKAALPPGSLVHIGPTPETPPSISILEYDQDNFSQIEDASEQDLGTALKKDRVTWFKVQGVHQPEIVSQLGRIFNLHPLVMEDILNSQQRPKLESFDEYEFLALKAFEVNDSQIQPRHLSLILGRGYVLTFQDSDFDPFGPILERIASGKGRIRHMGADYLACALLDLVVDGYFQVMEQVSENLEKLEDVVLAEQDRETLEALYELKKEAFSLRKATWPLREVMAELSRGESALVTEAVLPFMRDVYDHTIQVIDGSESLRESLTTLKDIYLSSISNRMNQVMKVLTIIATLFIPLTFLAGVYGMNFKHMPELEWPWAYPTVLILMLVVVIAMLFYFRRKKWF